MNQLNKGVYFGDHKQKLGFDQLLLTDTIYTHEHVDWHCHQHPYFTYLLQGKLYESNKKSAYHLKPGSLLFHNWQDAHFNIKPPILTRGFHIELNANFFEKYELPIIELEGSLHLDSPSIKELMNKIFLEAKVNDESSQLTIEMMVLNIFCEMLEFKTIKNLSVPKWVSHLKSKIVEEPGSLGSLSDLAKQLNIHPVHLSREFPRYFKTTLGNYLRKQKVNKAALLIAGNELSLTEIGYACGFYDQSHFISNFKKVYNITPVQFRKKISRC